MGTKRGLTLGELLVVVVVCVLLAVMLLPALKRIQTRGRILACGNDLNTLAKGIVTYVDELGDHRFLPCPLGRGRVPDDYDGGEWLASLYWTRIVVAPGRFLCPGSQDSNDHGAHLGQTRAPAEFGPRTVSYAGLHWRSVRPEGAPLCGDLSSARPIASDDTEASVNHPPPGLSGVSVVYGDGHTDFRSFVDGGANCRVGFRGGLLAQLRN